MGRKSERIAELEKEAAAHNMQCNFLHEGNAALQKTIADLRREVVLRTQETRDLQNSKYLLWKKCNALQETVDSLKWDKHYFLSATGKFEHVSQLECEIKELVEELSIAHKRVRELELSNQRLERHSYLFELYREAKSPLGDVMREYLAEEFAKRWASKGFAEHVRREKRIRFVIFRDNLPASTPNFNKPKF